MVNKKAIKLINNEEYEKANQLSFILFQKKNIKEFLEIIKFHCPDGAHFTCCASKPPHGLTADRTVPAQSAG